MLGSPRWEAPSERDRRLACWVCVRVAAPSASAVDVYSFANGCYALRDLTTNRFVVRDGLGYSATAATVGAATPFRMQATALGRYLLYGPVGRMPSTAPLNGVGPTATPGPAADWRLQDVAGKLRLTSVSTGKQLGVGAAGRLTQVATGPARWGFVRDDGLLQVPRGGGERHRPALQGLEPDRQGARLPGRSHPPRRVRVPRRALPLRPAMEPVRRHGRAQGLPRPLPNGAGAVVENFLSNGSPVGTHSPEGWPSFAGWPRDESQTHEGTYWKWIERAWRSGLRLMVNDLVENRALCELYP